jgi:mRNA interferase YafQ
MYEIFQSSRYKKSLKKIIFSGTFDRAALVKVMDFFSKGLALPTIYRDHQLVGDMAGNRECHIKSDLILIYEVDSVEMIVALLDIGSHSDLFG